MFSLDMCSLPVEYEPIPLKSSWTSRLKDCRLAEENSINAYRRCFGQFVEGSHAADAVPGVFDERHLAFAFVSLHEAGDEKFLRQRRQLYAAGLAVADDLIVIVEFHHLDRGPRLRCIIAD